MPRQLVQAGRGALLRCWHNANSPQSARTAAARSLSDALTYRIVKEHAPGRASAFVVRARSRTALVPRPIALVRETEPIIPRRAKSQVVGRNERTPCARNLNQTPRRRGLGPLAD